MQIKNIWLIQTDQPTIIHFDHTGFFTSVNFQESKKINSCCRGFNAYITKEDEDINENDFIITKDGRLVEVTYLLSKDLQGASKVVLSTDKAIVKDSGSYLILNYFLEWFINKANDSGKPIDFVQVNKIPMMSNNGRALYCYSYEVVIPEEDVKCSCILGEAYNNTCCNVHGNMPKEESKQVWEQIIETCGGKEEFMKSAGLLPKEEKLEEVAKKYFNNFDKRFGFIEGAKWQQEPEQFFKDERVKTLEKSIKYLLKRQEESYTIDQIKNAIKNSYGLKYFSENKFLENLKNI